MIKYFLCILIYAIISDSCLAGVSVLGTRFFIDDSTKALNIKVINDNESDYLIKATINSDGFIISPPLFILPKNNSNIITIIPEEIIKNNKDKVYSLTITTIPKSAINDESNVVSLAIRSHFNLIYQHSLPTDKDFNEIKLIRSQDGNWFLSNKTDFSFIISLSKELMYRSEDSKVLAPGTDIFVNKFCSETTCSLGLTILDGEQNFVKKLNLISR